MSVPVRSVDPSESRSAYPPSSGYVPASGAVLQERVDELQEEIRVLDSKLRSHSKLTLILFLSAIAAPFVIYAFIYWTGLKWVRTDGKRDRKKAVKWTIVIVIPIWVVLFACAWWFSRAPT